MLPSTAITRTDLASTFHEFDVVMSRKRFIGPRALRPRLVGVQAADVGKVPIEALLRNASDARSAGAGYKRDDFEFTKFSYTTDEHGREAPLDDRQLPAEVAEGPQTNPEVLRQPRVPAQGPTIGQPDG